VLILAAPLPSGRGRNPCANRLDGCGFYPGTWLRVFGMAIGGGYAVERDGCFGRADVVHRRLGAWGGECGGAVPVVRRERDDGARDDQPVQGGGLGRAESAQPGAASPSERGSRGAGGGGAGAAWPAPELGPEETPGVARGQASGRGLAGAEHDRGAARPGRSGGPPEAAPPGRTAGRAAQPGAAAPTMSGASTSRAGSAPATGRAAIP
jgi:hypothetical protein